MKISLSQVVITIILVVITIINSKNAFNSASQIWEGINDFSMLMVALGALIIAVYTSHLQKQHNYKSMKPLLHFNYTSHEEDKVMTLTLRNDGKGPAIVKKYSLYNVANNHRFSRNRNFEDFAKKALVKEVTPGATFLSTGDVIKSEGEYTLVKIDFSKTSHTTLKQVKKFVLGLKVVVEYTDVYDRTFDQAIQEFKKGTA